MISWLFGFVLSALALCGVIPDQGYSKDTLLIVMIMCCLGANICRRVPKEDGSL